MSERKAESICVACAGAGGGWETVEEGPVEPRVENGVSWGPYAALQQYRICSECNGSGKADAKRAY